MSPAKATVTSAAFDSACVAASAAGSWPDE